MRVRPLLAAVMAASLLAAPLRSEAEKPEPPKPGAPEKRASGEPPSKKVRPKPPGSADGNPAKPGKPLPPVSKKPGPPPSGPGSPEMRTWLGISTNYLDPALRQHLEIPEGFGVQIVEVMPGSPAAAAKLRANDVLVRFGDQRLISPEHLALLVRERARGDRVSLTLIRKGREEVVEAELGESDEVAFGPFGAGPRFLPVPPPGEEARQWQDRIRKQQDEMLRRQQDYWHQWMDKHRPGWRGGQEPAKPPKTPGAKPGEDAAKPGGGTPGLSVSPGFPLHIFGTEGVLKIDNEQGELTLTRKDGNHHLLIQDHLGKLVYDGPFDPEKGVEGLPENARRQLEAMKLGNLEIRLPEPPVVPPGKTADPDAGKDKPTGNEGELL